MDRVRFKINDEEYSVGSEVSSDETLLDFLRERANLRGTKYMCREAGCGACVVAHKLPGGKTLAVNSCMVSVTSCQDWEITTIEKVGNKLQGYHPVQTTLAKYNGTQCGYCTPGWVMAMYSLLQSKKNLTKLQIEKSLNSNICRCTGYRPILEAFKIFGIDAPEGIIPDIEELSVCKKTGKICPKKGNCHDDEDEWCVLPKDNLVIDLKDGKTWYRAHNLLMVLAIFLKISNESYMLVAGNTAKGAYPIYEYPLNLIDISNVRELKGYKMDQNLVVGAGTTLSELLDIFAEIAKQDYFYYLKKLYKHVLLIAHIAVRNIGTIAGNLMIKHQHQEFQSDIFLLLETVGAEITIVNQFGLKQQLTMQKFLDNDMKKKVILNVMFPPLSSDYSLVTFKVMPRSQTAHALVNAGFLIKFDKNNKIVKESRIIYGGLSPAFNRAKKTEQYLFGKNIFTNTTLQAAINILKDELVVQDNPPEASVGFRKQLALNLFYKGLLKIYKKRSATSIAPTYISGTTKIHEKRPESKAEQIYDTNTNLWPLNQPVEKLEALYQCAGEAPYSEDLPSLPREVFAVFVLSTVATGTIVSIDPSPALKMKGVIAFYKASDIPGVNSFTPIDFVIFTNNEEVVSNGEIKYYNQPIGIIVAESRALAEKAAKKVDVVYNMVRKPVIDIRKASKEPQRNTLVIANPAKEKGDDIEKVIKGGNTIFEQYHFTMENLVCVVKPIEEGLEVHPTTQGMDALQMVISRALLLDQSRIDIYTRRLGGAYGIKISRGNQLAVACSLVAVKLNSPCRFIQSLTTTMRSVGKRLPCTTTYEMGVNRSGVIQYIDYNLYEDNGYTLNETLAQLGIAMYSNCYDESRWNHKCFNTVTDKTKHTWCRSPGTLENISMAEWVLERISYELSLDPIEVRLANLNTSKYNDLAEMAATIKANSNYSERRAAVDKFNKENRWKKRGLRCSFLRWTPAGGTYFNVHVSIYHGDGSVTITHSGVEMGQGINTKAAQICSYLLNVPLERIQVKGFNSNISPNTSISGGSLTSINVGVGIQRCCEEILKQINPVRDQMDNPSWAELIAKAYGLGIDLQAKSLVNYSDMQEYDVFGVTVAEVEIDVLTGESEVIRVDLLEDVGQSVNPEIDVGQLEGAFIMGLGYWTCEELVYDENKGEILTDRAWNYYVPMARDIPQDFRVYFREKSYTIPKFFGAKATGEPAICMSVVIAFAIREAIAAARLDSGIPTTSWFDIDGAYTVEKICMACATKTEDFKFI